MSHPLRVLMVEDSEDDALLIARALRHGGYDLASERVDTVEAFDAALTQQTWEVVIADYAMPHFGGLAALKRVQEMGLDVPFILVSGTIGEDSAVAAMKAGAHDYVMKDSLTRLVPAVQRELRDAESRQARRRAEERLRESEARYRQSVENSPNPIFAVNNQGAIQMWNRACEQVFQYTTEQIMGQVYHQLLWDSQDHDTLDDLLAQVWQGLSVHEQDMHYRCGDGTQRFMVTRIYPVRDLEGEVEGCVFSNTDITELKSTQAQLLQAQKMEAMGRLAGGVAHDFNNMLTIVHLSTQLLKRQLRPEDPLREYVQQIEEAGERATALTKQLLSFSRRDVIEPHVVNLSQQIGNLSRMLQRIIGEDIELVAVLPDDLWPVYLDPAQSDQVVVNLAVNARDAMPNGGCLAIETANVVLDEASVAHQVDVQPGEYVRLTVRDNGVGMNDEVKAHLFEPFFTTKERDQGTGLGLSTVFGIVKQNGGHIWVDSAMGKGTTLQVYIPRTKRVEAKGLPRVTSARAARGSETILVVEDYTGVRDLAARILKAHGYQVLAAKNGPEALHISQEHKQPIHLLLTDMVMPHMNGKELAEQIQSQRPGIRMLYMSGYDDRLLEYHTALGESVAFLAKPFTVDSLTEKVRAVLDLPLAV